MKLPFIIMFLTIPMLCFSQEGCTDPFACNYDVDAVEDNGECLYATLLQPDFGEISEEDSCYQSTIQIDAIDPESQIEQIEDLQNVVLSIEHSYMADLIISITCPNGQSLSLHEQGGSGTDLGIPLGFAVGYPFEYRWSHNAPMETWAVEGDSVITLPEGIYSSVGDWSELIGCPVNGNWSIEVCDVWGGDNGYAFYWGLAFDEGFIDLQCPGDSVVFDCIDSQACNYNPEAMYDDGSCTYPGCNDILACNYDPEAGCSDGTCIFPGYANLDTAFIPDDQTECYGPVLNVYNDDGAFIEALSDIISVGATIEHSFLGDLTVDLICPNGQSLSLHSGGGGPVWLGEPIDEDTDEYGVGYDYDWSPSPEYGTWEEEAALQAPTLGPGVYSAVGDWENLVGCPVNGDWQIEFCDLWASDNGYAFAVRLTFAEGVAEIGCDSTLIGGCTDPSSCNYLSYATVNNGSCEYVELYEIIGNTLPFVSLEVQEFYEYPSTSGSSYTWEVQGGVLDFGQGSPYVYVTWTDLGPASISVTETREDGCESETVTLSVETQSPINLASPLGELGVAIYPNPARDQFWVRSSELITGIQLFDLQGRSLFYEPSDSTNLKGVTVDGSLHGIYILKVNTTDGTFIGKITFR